MSREIKFRFYNRKIKKMSNPYGVGLIWEHLVEEWGVFEWKDIEILQYTGLQDKNGKDVYEENIVMAPTFSGEQFHKAIVTWDKQRCGFKLKPIGPPVVDRMLFVIGGEVIGNVHENPELLA